MVVWLAYLEVAMEILKSMSWLELSVYGALFLAALVVIFWLYYRGKP